MANITVTITESVTLNSVARGSTNTKTISGVLDVYERVITVPTSEVILYATHASAVAGGTLDDDLIKYARVTNLDGSNFVTLRVTNDGSDETLLKLQAGESCVLFLHDDSTSMAAGGAANATLHAITSVKATANTAACSVEVFVASA